MIRCKTFLIFGACLFSCSLLITSGCTQQIQREMRLTKKLSSKIYKLPIPKLWSNISTILEKNGFYGLTPLPKEWKSKKSMTLTTVVRYTPSSFLSSPHLRQKEYYRVHIFKLGNMQTKVEFYHLQESDNSLMSKRDWLIEDRFEKGLPTNSNKIMDVAKKN